MSLRGSLSIRRPPLGALESQASDTRAVPEVATTPAPGQAPNSAQNTVIPRNVAELAYYGSALIKLAQSQAPPSSEPQDEGQYLDGGHGISGEDSLVIQKTSPNAAASHLELMLRRTAPPGFDFSRDPATIPAEEKERCAPHLFRQSKGGFSDFYLSDEFCRCLATTHFEHSPVPALGDYTSQQKEYPCPQSVAFEKCAKCDGNFTYSLAPDVEPVVVVKGVPAPGTFFQAISYVWGETITHDIPCKSCDAIVRVPLRESPSTLHTLLNQVGPGATVWLDCVSIDQSSPADIAAILPQMGAIYGGAERVCVVLPAPDTTIFDLLGMAFCAGWMLLCSKEDFAHNRDVSVASNRKEQMLSSWTKEFIELVENVDRNLGQSVYFRRAWTFQEWVLAREIDITHTDAMGLVKIKSLKSVVIDAACLWGRYIMLANQHAVIDAGRHRGQALAFVSKVKKLFPHEDFWLGSDEIDAHESSFQSGGPNVSGVEHALGIRPKDEVKSVSAGTKEQKLQDSERKRIARRLTTMLTAFSASARQARYQADIVACWASMCNIRYPYDRNDSEQQALAKVVPAVRQQYGLKIFNFFVTNDDKPLSMDGSFMRLAGQQHLSNVNSADTMVPLPGAPAFTGRVDTGKHLLESMLTPYEVFLPSREEDVTVRRVAGAQVVAGLPLSLARSYELTALLMATTYGMDSDPTSDVMFIPPLNWAPSLFDYIKRAMPGEFLRRAFVLVRIPATIPDIAGGDAPAPAKKVNLWAWLIGPYPVAMKYGPPLFIGRESLNGTLMLFQEISLGKGLTIRSPIGYLVVSDFRAGSFLIPTSLDGKVEIHLPGANVPGMVNSEYISDRTLRCSVGLAEEENVSIPEALR